MRELLTPVDDFDIDYVLENASSLEKISLLAGETMHRALVFKYLLTEICLVGDRP